MHINLVSGNSHRIITQSTPLTLAHPNFKGKKSDSYNSTKHSHRLGVPGSIVPSTAHVPNFVRPKLAELQDALDQQKETQDTSYRLATTT